MGNSTPASMVDCRTEGGPRSGIRYRSVLAQSTRLPLGIAYRIEDDSLVWYRCLTGERDSDGTFVMRPDTTEAPHA